MADYIVIPASICYRIPDNHRDQNYMAVCEPMSCAAHLVFDQCEIRGGDVVVVMGPGALGQAAAQMAKAAGAFVIVSGVPKAVSYTHLDVYKRQTPQSDYLFCDSTVFHGPGAAGQICEAG